MNTQDNTPNADGSATLAVANGSAARALHALNLLQSIALMPDGAHPRNVLREYISGPACESCHAEASRITEDGVRLCAKCYSECPPEEGPPSEDEKHAARHRVMLAESALAKARQAVAEAEVELALARSIAASVLSPNTVDEPRGANLT